MSEERKIPCGTDLLPIYGDPVFTSLVACDISATLRAVVERYRETGEVEKVLLVHTKDEELIQAQLSLISMLDDPKDRNAIWSGVRVSKLTMQTGEPGDAERLRDCVREVADGMSGKFTVRQLMERARRLFADRFSR
jgi:hypothetical protein